MEKKPLTANDLVVGGKYMVYGDICEYLYKSGVAYVFSKLNCTKTICLESLSGVIQITTADEPNKTTMEYTEQPFNLETALKHPEWVRTRDGREIDFIKEYPEKPNDYKVVVVMKNAEHFSYARNGLYQLGEKLNNDLILRVPYRTVWVNLFKNKEAEWSDSEQGCNDGRTYDRIACVPVKIPVI